MFVISITQKQISESPYLIFLRSALYGDAETFYEDQKNILYTGAFKKIQIHYDLFVIVLEEFLVTAF